MTAARPPAEPAERDAAPARHPVDEILAPGPMFVYGLQHVLSMYAGVVAVPLVVGTALKLPRRPDLPRLGRPVRVRHRDAPADPRRLEDRRSSADRPGDVVRRGVHHAGHRRGRGRRHGRPARHPRRPAALGDGSASSLRRSSPACCASSPRWSRASSSPSSASRCCRWRSAGPAAAPRRDPDLRRRQERHGRLPHHGHHRGDLPVCPAVLSRVAILLGLVLGTVVAIPFGLTDFGAISDASIFQLTTPFHFGLPTFAIGATVSMVVVMLVIMTETTADILAIGQVIDKPADRQTVTNGLRADMLSTAFGRPLQRVLGQCLRPERRPGRHHRHQEPLRRRRQRRDPAVPRPFPASSARWWPWCLCRCSVARAGPLRHRRGQRHPHPQPGGLLGQRQHRHRRLLARHGDHPHRRAGLLRQVPHLVHRHLRLRDHAAAITAVLLNIVFNIVGPPRATRADLRRGPAPAAISEQDEARLDPHGPAARGESHGGNPSATSRPTSSTPPRVAPPKACRSGWSPKPATSSAPRPPTPTGGSATSGPMPWTPAHTAWCSGPVTTSPAPARRAFHPEVVVVFRTESEQGHYHIPLLLSPSRTRPTAEADQPVGTRTQHRKRTLTSGTFFYALPLEGKTTTWLTSSWRKPTSTARRRTASVRSPRHPPARVETSTSPGSCAVTSPPRTPEGDNARGGHRHAEEHDLRVRRGRCSARPKSSCCGSPTTSPASSTGSRAADGRPRSRVDPDQRPRPLALPGVAEARTAVVVRRTATPPP